VFYLNQLICYASFEKEKTEAYFTPSSISSCSLIVFSNLHFVTKNKLEIRVKKGVRFK